MTGYLKREISCVLTRCFNTLEGLRFAWREEASFSQWVVANVVSASRALVIEMSTAERALIIGFGLMVLVAELLNTGSRPQSTVFRRNVIRCRKKPRTLPVPPSP